MPTEALPITRNKLHGTGHTLCLSGTATTTPSDTDGSYESPSLDYVAGLEALLATEPTHPTSNWGMNHVYAPSSLDEDLSFWFPGNAAYWDDWYKPQSHSASDHATQVTQSPPSFSVSSSFSSSSSSSSSSSASSAFAGYDTPDSAAFSNKPTINEFQGSPSEFDNNISYGVASSFSAINPRMASTFDLMRIGDEPSMLATRPQEQSSINQSNIMDYFIDHDIYSKTTSVESEPGPGLLNGLTALSHSQATGTKLKQPTRKPSEKSVNRKRKHTSNVSNTSQTSPSTPAQNHDPMLTVNPQAVEHVSDITATKTLLACHFYKMNPKQHSGCADKTFQSISSLGQHLRNAHSPKGRDHTCNACFQSYKSEAVLHAHTDSGYCRPTGGVSAGDLPSGSHRHDTPASKWYTVWDQLFPRLGRPHSPYAGNHHEIDQFVQSFLRTMQEDMPELTPQNRKRIATLLKGRATRWRTEQGEPLDHSLC
ncbi:hypothetical protein PG999_011508 [Apiospora kogelbergensis]|uniref:C2H2-type domain-containing protein n=1 Tax=Apiospora kogelbergensis TaxID=1337665 RepID=A0AAW0QPK2_9PEZI